MSGGHIVAEPFGDCGTIVRCLNCGKELRFALPATPVPPHFHAAHAGCKPPTREQLEIDVRKAAGLPEGGDLLEHLKDLRRNFNLLERDEAKQRQQIEKASNELRGLPRTRAFMFDAYGRDRPETIDALASSVVEGVRAEIAGYSEELRVICLDRDRFRAAVEAMAAVMASPCRQPRKVPS